MMTEPDPNDDLPADEAGKVLDPDKAVAMLPAGERVPVLIPWPRDENGVAFAAGMMERAPLIAALRDRPVRWSPAPMYWDGYRLCLSFGGETIYVRTARSLFQ